MEPWHLLSPAMIGVSIPLATILLAQGTPASGWEGWAGASLLGAVLYWLLFHHLPAKDAQIKTLLDAKDAQIKQINDSHDVRVNNLVSNFREEVRIEREHCATHVEVVQQHYHAESQARIQALDAIREDRAQQHRETVDRLERLENQLDDLREPGRRRAPRQPPGSNQATSGGGP